jgi:hypothetical protein
MTKLLANRWFRWTLLAIALSGLGVGIYRFTPPERVAHLTSYAGDVAFN